MFNHINASRHDRAAMVVQMLLTNVTKRFCGRHPFLYSLAVPDRFPFYQIVLRTYSIAQNATKIDDDLCQLREVRLLADALETAEIMQNQGLHLARDQAYQLLQVCVKQRDLEHGRKVQFLMIHNSLDSVGVLGDHLVRLFANHSSLHEANQAFKKIAEPTEYTWAAIILANANVEQGNVSIDLYNRMQLLGAKTNRYVYAAILKACIMAKSLRQGRIIHDQIIRDGVQLDALLGSLLIDMYGKFGNVEASYKVFNELSNRDIVVWNTMATAYVENGYEILALENFQKMQLEGLEPDKVTFLSILKACSKARAIKHGQEIHNMIVKRKLQSDTIIGNALVDMYTKCDSLEATRKVFDGIQNRDSVSWNSMVAAYIQHEKHCEALECLSQMQREGMDLNIVAWSSLIAGYTQRGQGFLALEFFHMMQQEGIDPDVVLFLDLLKACARMKAIEQARVVHVMLIESGLQLDGVVGNALVDMYAKCGSLKEACNFFRELPNRSAISWSALIAGYNEHGEGDLALGCFQKMQERGIQPDEVAFLNILKSCSSMGAIEHGRLIHEQIMKSGLCWSIIIKNSLINMYAKCGHFSEAFELFDQLSNRNIVSWGAMIVAYAQHAEGSSAIDYFDKMQQEGIKPDSVIFSSILKACSNTRDVIRGRLVHEQIIENDLHPNDVILNALVHMYAQCCSLDEATRVFGKLQLPDVVSWGTMIGGYAQHGKGVQALEDFQKMRQQGIKPNLVTYLNALKACASLGAIEYGRFIHNSIIESELHSNIVIGSTLVDMYAKCGSLNEAHKSKLEILCHEMLLSLRMHSMEEDIWLWNSSK